MSTIHDAKTPAGSASLVKPDKVAVSAGEWQKYVKPLASMKLSIVLFSLGIFLVVAGTLAQVEQDILEVVHGYFRCWLAWIDFQVFFPKTWVPGMQNISGGIWFPGGWTIGTLMIVNLLAAHSLRFKVLAKGQSLIWGLVIIAVGIVLTWAVIEVGTARNSVYETGNFNVSSYWNIFCYSLLLPAIGCGVAATRYASDASKKIEFWTYSLLCLFFLSVALFLIAGGESVRLDNSSLRILWQLLQATFVAGVFLGGCLLLFKKRAGVVLLHAGVLMIMFNEIVVHQFHEEANIILFEGETVNFTRDTRTFELAFINSANKDYDEQTVIPARIITEAVKKDQVIQHPDIPVDVKVRQFEPNATIRKRAPDDNNPATVGIGKTDSILPQRKSAGTDNNADYPAAYIDLVDKQTGQTLDTFLVSAKVEMADKVDQFKVQDQEYGVSLRFKRTYKPYSVHLIDVRRDNYIGTNTPMNYSSDIRLVDKTRNEDRQVKIWMNNPLRYAGETFYQSGYQSLGTQELTTLQVVTNDSWMIPYVASMIVFVGMMYQFMVTLLRFLDRAASGKLPAMNQQESEQSAAPAGKLGAVTGFVIPTVLVVMVGYWLLTLAKVPVAKDDEMDLYAFGQIPVVYEGRVKPLDTLARNTLRILSNRETIVPEDPKKYGADEKNQEQTEATKTDDNNEKKPRTYPAVLWLLELATASPEAAQRHVFRIDNEELLTTLKLDRRKSKRYTLEELRPQLALLKSTADEARALNEKSPEALSVYQRKVLELDRKLGRLQLITYSFLSPPIDPNEGQVAQQIQFALSEIKKLDANQPPLLIPPAPETTKSLDKQLQRNTWETYSKAFLLDVLYIGMFRVEGNPFSNKFAEIVLAFQEKDAPAFNKAVKEYHTLLKTHKVDKLNPAMLAYETNFNSFAPFFWPAYIYLLAFVLAIVGCLFPPAVFTLNRSALALILVTFAVHTWAIWARIQISGRPPVTNLYSSAVFIGWAAVLFGMVMELFYKRGIGNVLAATAGFGSLWIAHGLAGDGDTFVVLQAVLDTQFWLSTHVVFITLGYAATFVAGLLGVIYVTRRNPLALLSVSVAATAAVAMQDQTQVPTLLRNTGPYLLAIPLSLIPMYLIAGSPQFKLSEYLEKSLSRMIYGTLCFALLFSFFGTVLGGLWADDSWGRFWGWDPKENGALIIVLWNALVLHARWDRIIKDRGLALLAIAGNITTAWSWFGVNELGVGLHSYGFTDGVLFNLTLFVMSQLTLIIIGAWGTHKTEKAPQTTA